MPLETTHSKFAGNAIAFLSELQPIDFEQPRALYRKVMAKQPGAQQRLVQNIAGHMRNCRRPDIIRQQLAIFHEVDSDLARRLSAAVGVSGYSQGVKGLNFNGRLHISDSNQRYS